MPLARQLQPQQCLTDMQSWRRYKAGQYSLDWQAGILYQLNGMSQEAEGRALHPQGSWAIYAQNEMLFSKGASTVYKSI